jgi:dynein heavy chain, axonemal
MAMTPLSEILRNRVRQYPSLFNCSTVIWYREWPDEALQVVGERFIQDLYLEPEITKGLILSCKYMHKTVVKLSEDYLRLESRQNYITPKSYLELIYLVQALIGQQRKKIDDKRQMYAVGVKKLLETAENVKKMEEILIEKTPQLVKTKEEVSKMAKKIQEQADAMEPKRKKVEVEEGKVNERVKEAELIKEECDKDLSEARPKLKKAEEALNTLDQNEINKLKAMLTPPDTVRLVLEAVCVLCSVRPVSIPGPINPKERVLSYWEASKKFMGEKDFLQKLINYDKDNISENVINRIRSEYVSRTNDFNPKRAEKASSAVKGLCEWVLAIDDYEKVLRIVRPKQQRATEARKEVEDLQISLKKTQEELMQLTQEISKLKEEYNFTLKKEESLERDIIKCETQIKRAGILVNGLSGERNRWGKLTESLQKSLEFVVGDVLISSATISYLGNFFFFFFPIRHLIYIISIIYGNV